MKHIVFYSGGLGSWATAKRVVQAEGAENVICMFTDTLIEDEDLYRFLLETTQDIYGVDNSDLIEKARGIVPVSHETMDERKRQLTELAAEASERNPNFVWINDGRDPWDVFFDVRFLGNSRLAQCSHELKQKQSAKWLKERYTPEECVLYLGIDWTEEHRTKAPRKNWAPYEVRYPMCEEPLLTKIDVAKALVESGIEQPKLYDLGFSHNNCFSGDTRFITDEGVFRLDEKVGESVRVLGKGGRWKDATVSSFGHQKIYELKLKRYNQEKTIRTTAEHGWFVRKGRDSELEKQTKDLIEGDKIVSNYLTGRKNYKITSIPVMHGLVYGDGSVSTVDNARGGRQPSKITLCGEKEELKTWFEGYDYSDVDGVGISFGMLPRTFKELPILEESKAYLYSWLAGYFAADGSVSNTEITLSSSKKENLEYVKNVCAILGIGTNSIRVESRCGFNDYETDLFSVNLVGYTLNEQFFLRSKHREQFNATYSKRPAEWKIDSVSETEDEEEVYCAYVPDGHQFTLEDNQKTRNCGGFCVRAGQGHFANLLEQRPKLFRYHEEREQEIREYLDKDVSILKRQRKGVIYRLTLRQLREELEAEKTEQIDFTDIGGCGCFVDDGSES